MAKVEYKLFFAWNENEEQAYLEQKAREGWLLSSRSFFRYVFVPAEPGEYFYQFDYSGRQDYVERMNLIVSCGWVHVLSYSGWHYYRAKRGDVDSKALYTDADSLREKYHRLLRLLIVIGGINLVSAVNLLVNTPVRLIGVINLAVVGALGYASYRVYRLMFACLERLRR